MTPPRPAGGPGLAGAGGGGPARAGGYLEVKTTNLTPGWLRRNGVPYSEDAVVTEYFARFAAPNGDEWLMVTTIVDDPRYLTQRYVTSSHFRREPKADAGIRSACGAGVMSARALSCVALLAVVAAAGAHAQESDAGAAHGLARARRHLHDRRRRRQHDRARRRRRRARSSTRSSPTASDVLLDAIRQISTNRFAT